MEITPAAETFITAFFLIALKEKSHPEYGWHIKQKMYSAD
jgi:hypothetical protein|tara:strand:+ start:425 stop:544 length:120 start_codon:yes stop_codon:yes gene_type:complete